MPPPPRPLPPLLPFSSRRRNSWRRWGFAPKAERLWSAVTRWTQSLPKSTDDERAVVCRQFAAPLRERKPSHKLREAQALAAEAAQQKEPAQFKINCIPSKQTAEKKKRAKAAEVKPAPSAASISMHSDSHHKDLIAIALYIRTGWCAKVRYLLVVNVLFAACDGDTSTNTSSKLSKLRTMTSKQKSQLQKLLADCCSPQIQGSCNPILSTFWHGMDGQLKASFESALPAMLPNFTAELITAKLAQIPQPGLSNQEILHAQVFGVGKKADPKLGKLALSVALDQDEAQQEDGPPIVSECNSARLPVALHDAAPSRVYGCAEENHLHRVALLPTTRALDMVYLTLVVNVSKGAGCVVHRSEVIEETPQGMQGLHVVSSFDRAIVMFALPAMTSKAACRRASLNAFLMSISRRAHILSSGRFSLSKSSGILAQRELPSLRPPAHWMKLGNVLVKYAAHSSVIEAAARDAKHLRNMLPQRRGLIPPCGLKKANRCPPAFS